VALFGSEEFRDCCGECVGDEFGEFEILSMVRGERGELEGTGESFREGLNNDPNEDFFRFLDSGVNESEVTSGEVGGGSSFLTLRLSRRDMCRVVKHALCYVDENET